jgi:small subunit ribosomal protein S1
MTEERTPGGEESQKPAKSRPRKAKDPEAASPIERMGAQKGSADTGGDHEESEFEQLLKEDARMDHFREGNVVRGKVLQITENEVIVDVGYKSEGIIPLHEFPREKGKYQVGIGDEIDVLIESREDADGHVVLSKEKAEKMKIWDSIERAYKKGETVKGRVVEKIKGGIVVDIGVRAFLPGSQIDIRPVRNLDSLIGQEFEMKVIKVNKRRGNIVLSRKIVLEELNSDRRGKTLEKLEEGKLVKGTVKNITEYGAFIDLGGIDGLLHITDMSWGRVEKPSDLFKIGDEVEVVVLKFDRENEKVSLGYKQKTPDPWESVQTKYPVNTRVQGKVVNLADYGAFVELEPGVEGLIHVSEMSWTKRVKHPSKVLSEGEMVECVVLDVDPAQRRISLGLKQTEPNPWTLLAEKYQPGDVLTGKVRNLTDFGAFVEIEEGIDGLVHVSDMSWTKRIKHPSEVLKKGETVEVKLLSIDAKNQRLSLGIKQLFPDVWEDFFKTYKVGDNVTGRVVRLTDFGLFVELQEGIEGFVHVSELDEERVETPSDKFKEGDEVNMKIIKIDIPDRKIGLSIKAVFLEEKEKDVSVKSYASTPSSGMANIGDLIDSKTREKERAKEKEREREK